MDQAEELKKLLNNTELVVLDLVDSSLPDEPDDTPVTVVVDKASCPVGGSDIVAVVIAGDVAAAEELAKRRFDDTLLEHFTKTLENERRDAERGRPLKIQKLPWDDDGDASMNFDAEAFERAYIGSFTLQLPYRAAIDVLKASNMSFADDNARLDFDSITSI